jgi:hypothetical protein
MTKLLWQALPLLMGTRQAGGLCFIARSGEIKRDGAAGVHLAVGRAGDMFFVLIWKNSPSGRMHVVTMLKKIVYDAFEK